MSKSPQLDTTFFYPRGISPLLMLVMLQCTIPRLTTSNGPLSSLLHPAKHACQCAVRSALLSVTIDRCRMSAAAFVLASRALLRSRHTCYHAQQAGMRCRKPPPPPPPAFTPCSFLASLQHAGRMCERLHVHVGPAIATYAGILRPQSNSWAPCSCFRKPTCSEISDAPDSASAHMHMLCHFGNCIPC